MSNPVKHHFVPQFYLRNWQNQEGRICCFRKQSNRFDLVVPKNLANQNNLYKFDSEIESVFITPFIDNYFSPLINKARDYPLESLTRNEKIKIIQFILLLHLRNPIEIKKLKSYQDELFLKNKIFNQLEDDIGKDDFFEFEQGYLRGLVTMVGLAMKEIGFCEDDLEKIKKHKNLFAYLYKRGLQSQESWSNEIIKKYKEGEIFIKEYKFNEPALIISNIPVYFGKPEGFLTIIFNVSPCKSYIITENRKIITDLDDKEESNIILFLNYHHFCHKNISEIYMHESQKDNCAIFLEEYGRLG